MALNIPAVRPGPRLPTEALEALVGLHRALAEVQARAGRDAGARSPGQCRTPRADAQAGQLLRRHRARRRRPADGHQVRRRARSPAPWSTGWPRTWVSGWCTPPICRSPPGPSPTSRTASSTCRSRTPGSTTPGRSRCRRSATSCWITRCRRTIRSSCGSGWRSTTSRRRCSSPSAGRSRCYAGRKAAKDIAIEDLRDAYAVSYETAAHRFTNLATRHLDLPVHFMRISSSGVIYKAYENDGVHFPTDATGAIEGQRVCRYWTARRGVRPAGPVRRLPAVHRHAIRHLLVHGVRRSDAGGGVLGQRRRAVRTREVDARPGDHRPVGVPLPRPGVLLAAARRASPQRWAGQAWPSARVHSHLLAAMPPGVFPGVDETEVLAFLERHSPV